jgi:hypothetical protein
MFDHSSHDDSGMLLAQNAGPRAGEQPNSASSRLAGGVFWAARFRSARTQRTVVGETDRVQLRAG